MSSSCKHSIFAEKRLAKDLQEWNKDPLPKCSLERIVDVQPWEFQLIMQGPRTSPYEGGTFYFSIKLAAQYPFVRPKVTCTTKIFHPNINENGFICIDMLEDPWKPTITLRTLAITLHSLLETPNIGDLLAPHAAYLYQANRNEFNKIAKKWTEDYAMGSKECTVEDQMEKMSIENGFSLPLKRKTPTSSDDERKISDEENETAKYSRRKKQLNNENQQRYIDLLRETQPVLGDRSNFKTQTSQELRICDTLEPFEVGQKNVGEVPIFEQCLQYGEEIQKSLNSYSDVIKRACEGIRKESEQLGKKISDKFLDELSSLENPTEIEIGMACLQLYTKDSFLYSAVNRCLREEDSDKIKTLGPYIYLLNLFFTHSDSKKIPDDTVVYRAVRFSNVILSKYVEVKGKGFFRWRGFTSTTNSWSMAVEIYEAHTLMIIRLKQTCQSSKGIDISGLSHFTEEEILLCSGVQFEVTEVKNIEVERNGEMKEIPAIYINAYI